MNTPRLLALFAAALFACAAPSAVFADAGHDHDHDHDHAAPAAKPAEQAEVKKPAGPNGGRILSELKPRVELWVTPERTVRLTFLDEAGKPAPVPAGATAGMVTGDRAAPTTLAFALDEKIGALVSKTALPDGKNMPAILSIQAGAEAKAARARVQLNLANCDGCDRPEYACTCGH